MKRTVNTGPGNDGTGHRVSDGCMERRLSGILLHKSLIMSTDQTYFRLVFIADLVLSAAGPAMSCRESGSLPDGTPRDPKHAIGLTRLYYLAYRKFVTVPLNPLRVRSPKSRILISRLRLLFVLLPGNPAHAAHVGKYELSPAPKAV